MVPIAALLLAVASVTCVPVFNLSTCTAPLGMETGLIPDVDITASSCYNDGNVAPQNGRLNSERAGGAWCPRSQIFPGSNEWLEIDFHAVHVVTAVATQGRFGNGQGQEFVEEYELQYWRPKTGKWIGYKDVLRKKTLSGNTNTYLVVKNHLATPVWASKVRFIPNSNHRRTVCMRVEVYGCLWDAGIVSYSMQAGDTRGNNMDYTDATYDGMKSGGELRGGLGQLVDGEFGETSRPTTWVGWRNDTRSGIAPRAPPTITFEFDRVREFIAVHVHCNNKFTRDVRAFSLAMVRFSIGGVHYQEEAVYLELPPDNIFESARNVTISLHHRIARWVQLELHFAARWILISEVSFESVPAQGNHTLERTRVAPAAGKGGARASPPLSPPSAPVNTSRPHDPIYVALIVGIMTALAILLSVAVFLLVQRHQHRKCFAPTLRKSTVSSPRRRALDDYGSCDEGRLNGEVRAYRQPLDRVEVAAGLNEYQEPYQTTDSESRVQINAATELLEMTRLHGSSLLAFDTESSNYDYAVPEACSTQLMKEPRGRLESLSTYCSTEYQSQFSFGKEGGVMGSVRQRTGGVPEVPAHRLRMISQIAEGTFGTVYVAEADRLPEYNSVSCVEKSLVAVKCLADGASKAEYEVFERDVHVLAALAHPCLSRVIGICRHPSAMVLEYLEGGDLRAYLSSVTPPPPLRILLHITEQLATGMAYLERLNFIHRDIAARNCIVGARFRIKISDFGTDNEIYARDYVTVEGRVLPLRWSAPEAALENQYSTRSDVWAFGITLHEVFTYCRRIPYAGLTDDMVLLNLRYLMTKDSRWMPIERVPMCPRDVYDMMVQCWSCDPRKRPAFRGVHSFLMHRESDTGTP